MQDTSSYRQLTALEHAKLRSGMYIGSTSTETVTKRIVKASTTDDVSSTTLAFCTETVAYNEGLMKIINEVVDNAVDNCYRDPPTTIIKVEMTTDAITVANNGKHIPVLEQDNQYIPTMIFSNMFAGSNFTEEQRSGIGTNGVGVSLTLAYSDSCTIICKDPIERKQFRQTFRDRLTITDNPIIKHNLSSKTLSKPSTMTTTVSFQPCLQVFPGIDSLDCIRDQVFTRLVQLSCIIDKPLKIYFDGKCIKTKTFKEYIKMMANGSKFYYDKVNASLEIGFCMSQHDSFEHDSFVNNTQNEKGGTHTKFVADIVVKIIQSHFKKASKQVRITPGMIKNRLHIFVNLHLPNPEFNSQTKTELTSKLNASNYAFDEKKILASIKTCGILALLEEELLKKESALMDKSLSAGGKKKKTITGIPKYEGAHAAGTHESSKCTLYLTEGDSALTMIIAGMTVLGRKYTGAFPLRGKMLNVMAASKQQMMNNAELAAVMKILGLSLSCNYSTATERASLRYGHVCIMADADVDGFHITGLFLAFVAHFWPNLLQHGFVKRFVTPIIKTTHKTTKQSNIFFTVGAYNEWEAAHQHELVRYIVKYFKGLGTSTREESISYFKAIETHQKNITLDDCGLKELHKAFHPKQTNERKTWISQGAAATLNYEAKDIDISTFINTELLEYSLSAIERAIPCFVDGFKVSTRKIIFTSIKKFGVSNHEFKVAQLGSHVAATTQYIHGEQSLSESIIKMAQQFCGSNNLALLAENGAFGSRLQNGSDHASARYLYTCLRPYAASLFDERDNSLLEYRVEEGVSVEPWYYIPTIPLCLVNGARGIATGFKSELPCFNPLEIIDLYIDSLVSGVEIKEILPWYVNWTGRVVDTPKCWEFHGVVDHKAGSSTAIITELPPTISFQKYKELLEKMVEKQQIVSYTTDHVSENQPRFVIQLINKTLPEKLGLVDTISKGCMNFLDRDYKIKQFHCVKDLLEEWKAIKLEYMEKRRQSEIEKQRQTIEFLQAKLMFIQLLKTKQIDVSQMKDSDMLIQRIVTLTNMKREQVEKFIKLPFTSLVRTGVEALQLNMDNVIQQKQRLEQSSAASLWLDDLSKLKREVSTLYHCSGAKRKRQN